MVVRSDHLELHQFTSCSCYKKEAYLFTVLMIAGIILMLLIACFLWGYVRIIRRQKDAQALILTVTEAELPALVSECQSVFSEKLGKKLVLENPDHATKILDEALCRNNRMNTVAAFERWEHKGWYVKPMGAFL